MPPKDFLNLDKADAKAFLEIFAERAEPRLAEFEREVEARGGPSQSKLDGSPDSLVDVWKWFVAHAGDGDDELPPWYEPDSPEEAEEGLDPGVVHDVDGLALYLARAFRGALGDLDWGLGDEPKQKDYVSQNTPLLKGDGYDIDVLGVAQSLAIRARDGRDRDPQALLRTFNAWVDPLTT